MKSSALRPTLLMVLLCLCMPVATGATLSRAEKVRCTTLESRMDELRLRQRMGYTAKQGRVYKQKLAALKAEHRARCR